MPDRFGWLVRLFTGAEEEEEAAGGGVEARALTPVPRLELVILDRGLDWILTWLDELLGVMSRTRWGCQPAPTDVATKLGTMAPAWRT